MMHTPQAIKSFVAAEYAVTIEQLDSPTRQRHVVWPRHVAMYLSHHLTRHSCESLSPLFHRAANGTVSHGVRRVEADIRLYPKVRAEIETLIEKLKHHD